MHDQIVAQVKNQFNNAFSEKISRFERISQVRYRYSHHPVDNPFSLVTPSNTPLQLQILSSPFQIKHAIISVLPVVTNALYVTISNLSNISNTRETEFTLASYYIQILNISISC